MGGMEEIGEVVGGTPESSKGVVQIEFQHGSPTT